MRRAFTLMEVVVAMLLIPLLVAPLSSLLARGRTEARRSSELVDLLRRARQAALESGSEPRVTVRSGELVLRVKTRPAEAPLSWAAPRELR